MKKIAGISALIIVALIGAYFFAFAGDDEIVKNYPGEGKTIVAFGDSLVQGVGATSRDTNFVTLLSNKLGTKIINEGRGGDSSRDGLERVDDVLKHDPKLVIILLGGNDALRNIPQNETFSNIEKIIKKIQDSGSMVMLLGIQGGLLRDPYKKEFEALRVQYSTAYVESVLSGLIGNTKFMFDSIHPNDAGYARLADKIYPTVEKLLN